MTLLSSTAPTRTYIQFSDRARLPSSSNTMIDTSRISKPPPSYDADHTLHISPELSTNGTGTMPMPIELAQQRNIQIPEQKGLPVTMVAPPQGAAPNVVVMQPNPAPYPSVAPSLPDAATIGARYQAELFARCANGEHQPTRKYGPCGIITAVFLFPVGLICLFTNSERLCSRCGIRLS